MNLEKLVRNVWSFIVTIALLIGAGIYRSAKKAVNVADNAIVFADDAAAKGKRFLKEDGGAIAGSIRDYLLQEGAEYGLKKAEKQYRNHTKKPSPLTMPVRPFKESPLTGTLKALEQGNIRLNNSNWNLEPSTKRKV